jgi:hypothetical protein
LCWWKETPLRPRQGWTTQAEGCRQRAPAKSRRQGRMLVKVTTPGRHRITRPWPKATRITAPVARCNLLQMEPRRTAKLPNLNRVHPVENVCFVPTPATIEPGLTVKPFDAYPGLNCHSCCFHSVNIVTKYSITVKHHLLNSVTRSNTVGVILPVIIRITGY